MASDIASMTFLTVKLSMAIANVKLLMQKINEIETDTQTPAIEKLSQIKKIREELSKVGTEIDIIKKEITLLNAYRVN